jgi:hypothetical protein
MFLFVHLNINHKMFHVLVGFHTPLLRQFVRPFVFIVPSEHISMPNKIHIDYNFIKYHINQFLFLFSVVWLLRPSAHPHPQNNQISHSQQCIRRINKLNFADQKTIINYFIFATKNDNFILYAEYRKYIIKNEFVDDCFVLIRIWLGFLIFRKLICDNDEWRNW